MWELDETKDAELKWWLDKAAKNDYKALLTYFNPACETPKLDKPIEIDGRAEITIKHKPLAPAIVNGEPFEKTITVKGKTVLEPR